MADIKKDYFAKYYLANKEKIKARTKKWQQDNPEKAREKSARYKLNHPEKADRKKELHKKWRIEFPESSRKAASKWQKANPEIVRIISHNRRAKIKNNGKLSSGLVAKLFAYQNGLCACCYKSLGDDYHLDHIMPLKLGGTNTDDNMQLLRAKCNHIKSAKHPIDFMQSKGFLL